MKPLVGCIYVFSYKVKHGLLKIDKKKFMCSFASPGKVYLKKYCYAPDMQYEAVQTVLQQAVALRASWVA